MTKKDYQLLTDVIKGCVQDFPDKANRRSMDRLAYRLSLALGSENPRFNEAKFRRVCQPEVGDCQVTR